MRADEFDGTYVDLSQDKLEQRSMSDNRKTKFTLRHLNKLKKMRSAEDLERLMRMDTLEVIYGAGEEPAAGGIGM